MASLPRHILLAGYLAALLFTATRAAAEDCGNGTATSSIGATIEGLDWAILYTDDSWRDCGSNGEYFPQTQAAKIMPIISGAYSRHGGWGFDNPWFTQLPDPRVYAFDSSDTGTNNNDCITLDAKALRCASDPGLRWVTSHELFHGVQRRYLDNAGVSTALGSDLGAWFTEGTARTLDDRLDLELDAVGPFRTDTNRLLAEDEVKDGKNLGAYRDKSLFDLSYRACLFWSYCCEKLGDVNVEPDSGIDFILTLWQNVESLASNGNKDSFLALKQTIADEDESNEWGGQLRNVWHDYATCLYTREFDASTLPNANRYVFVDETTGLNGGSRYKDIVRAFTHDGNNPLPQTLASSVKRWGQQVFELIPVPPPDSVSCRAVGIRASSDKPVGWSLIGVQPAMAGGRERATALSKNIGTQYARAILNPGLDPLTRLGWVIVGLDDDANFKYTVDEGPVALSIVRPTFTRPAYPGPADDAGRILVRAFVDGPDGLKPEGAGTLSIKGLNADDFQVSVGGIDAPIITSGYVGGEYWLVCSAPNQAANGLYDVTVKLCPGALAPPTATNNNAVLYGDFKINHMLVIDSSGSMADPQDATATKLDAAKNAASLYIDAVNDNDRVGVVEFNGNGTECDDDAFDIVNLSTANAIQRGIAKGAVSILTAGGFTSIGDGLWKAQDVFDAAALPAEDIKAMVLLSDGDENEARFWDQTEICPGTLGDPAKDRFQNSDTFINAIGFGPQSNQALMQDIATFTDGDYTYVDVEEGGKQLRAGPLGLENELAEAYLTKLENARGLERLFYEAGNASGGMSKEILIPVAEDGVDQGTFVLNWSQSAGAVVVELRDPDSNLITGADAQIYTGSTHAVYHVNAMVAPGIWSFRMTSINDTDYIAALLGKLRFGVQLLTEVTQVQTGSTFGLPNFGMYEQGVPVKIRAIMTDSAGPIRNADITAQVLRPDGTFACGTLVLHDDGAHDDGNTSDGIYAAEFTDTSQAGTLNGVMNDGLNPPPGVNGTYNVYVSADGAGNLDQYFSRTATDSFHVYEADRNDLDNDGLKDTWEVYYGTDTTVDDAALTYDEDELTNSDEFSHGTNPFDDDTDNGGESDSSEVLNGRCPLDPTDDLLPCPQDVGVVTDTGDLNEDILQPLTLLLRFPVHVTYDRMHIFRADASDPTNFVMIADVDVNGPDDDNYPDTGLENGKTYLYRFQGVSSTGALSCMSRTVQGTAFADAIPPLGWVHINNGSLRADSPSVLITLNFSTAADQYRVSNAPFDGSEPYLPLPASNYLNRLLDPVPAGEELEVFVQYANMATGRESEVYRDGILYDPNGDFDNDTVPNSLDPDDDGDGVPDTKEIFEYHTDAYVVDSDGDGLDDGVEVNGGCTHPRNPDTDGDGLLDSIDLSPSSDLDGDYDVDLGDFALFQLCFTGPDNGPVPAGCECVDVDGDDDIDLDDYEAFIQIMTGP